MFVKFYILGEILFLHTNVYETKSYCFQYLRGYVGINNIIY